MMQEKPFTDLKEEIVRMSRKIRDLESVIRHLKSKNERLETENDELKQKLVNLFNSAISGGCFHGDL